MGIGLVCKNQHHQDSYHSLIAINAARDCHGILKINGRVLDQKDPQQTWVCWNPNIKDIERKAHRKLAIVKEGHLGAQITASCEKCMYVLLHQRLSTVDMLEAQLQKPTPCV